MDNHETDVIFLGLCERAAYVRDGNTNLYKWNVLGLKSIMLSHIFPILLAGIAMAFAVNKRAMSNGAKLKIIDNEKNDVGFINFDLNRAIPQSDSDASLRVEGLSVLVPEQGWGIFIVPMDDGKILIQRPGNYFLVREYGEDVLTVGQFSYFVVDPPPLTPERIAAIKSDPTAVKAVRMELGCRKCPSKYKLYAALEVVY